MPSPAEDRARAARLRDYVDMQLRFAALLSERGGRPLGASVASHTNLHRLLGLGVIRGTPRARQWQRFVDGLLEQPDHHRRLAWAMAWVARAPAAPAAPGQYRFGCFAFDDPDSGGVVSIHFENADGDAVSPLAALRVARRRDELRAMFSHLQRDFPAAVSVRGTSWLYHLEAYRRLFPPLYTGSRRPPEMPLHFHGSTYWGQFLDHRQRVRPEPRARFLARLASLDPARPEDVFPLQPLQVSAPLTAFYDHYGIEPLR